MQVDKEGVLASPHTRVQVDKEGVLASPHTRVQVAHPFSIPACDSGSTSPKGRADAVATDQSTRCSWPLHTVQTEVSESQAWKICF